MPPGEATDRDLVQRALNDEYQILMELGRGGMAIVFQARDRQLEREVAIKVLPFSLAFDAEFVERFQREARTAARLEHPNIIPIYRVGRSGHVIYFVMKFLRGLSLTQTLDDRHKLPPDEIRALLVQTAGALGYAHAHGIVHRDIKPDNVMFDELGHAIVTDFGIAKAASGTRLTGTGMSIGTPHYMSPEQARAQRLDGRSDIYSLGVVAYQCLAGHVPFDGEDAFAIGYKHIMEEVPVPPLATAEEEDLFTVIHRMMAKKPEDRFQSAEELVGALGGTVAAPLRPSRPRASEAEVPTVSLSAVDDDTTEPRPAPARTSAPKTPVTPDTPLPRTAPRRPTPPRKKRSGVLLGAILLLLVGGAGGGYYYLTQVRGVDFRTAFGAAPAAPARDSAAVDANAVDSAAADSAASDSAARDTAPVMVPVVESTKAAAAPPADTTSSPSSPPVVRPDSGILIVTGLPRGGRVYVDGTPSTDTTIELALGAHSVMVKATGYVSLATTAQIPRGDTVRVPGVLERVAVHKPAPADTAVAAAPKPVTPPAPKPKLANSCTKPGATYNADGSCFDTAPSQSGSPFFKVPANLPADVRIVLWVQVGRDGVAKYVAPADANTEPALQPLARVHAYNQRYRPAEKDGHAVDSWFQAFFISQH
ncbi:MAG TPA: protein kinase [Gemmatimonadales bacterium]|nr:protein kinase [Gemmatimonadales bacterium]